MHSRPGRQPNSKKSALVKVLVLVVVAVGLALYSLNTATDFIGVNQSDHEAKVEIPAGSSVMQIAGLLHENQIVQHPMVFAAYAKISGRSANFKAGEYLLRDAMAYGDIAAALEKGADRTDVVRLTFYEGMSQSDIANLLEKEGVCSAKEFHEYLASADLSGYEFVRMIPEDERFRPLEGYLFPDTYDFFQGEAVASVARKLLGRFDQMFTEEMYEQARALGMTVDDVVTLASIIQKECSVPSEMAKVSSVFHNRLNNPSEYPKLQSDVTIFYVNDDIAPYLTKKDQELYDKYNTYKCNGLPIGPICSPGADALKAALYPEKTNYNYFISDKEGNFIYAETLQQHNANIKEAGL